MIKITTKLGCLLAGLLVLSACSSVPQPNNEYAKALDDTKQVCAACAWLVMTCWLPSTSHATPQ